MSEKYLITKYPLLYAAMMKGTHSTNNEFKLPDFKGEFFHATKLNSIGVDTEEQAENECDSCALCVDC